MSAHEFLLFDTSLGPCGLAWGRDGITGTQLPEGSAPATRARLLERFPGAREGRPSAPARQARDGILALLGGAQRDLVEIPLDMSGIAPFQRRVYEAARAIRPGTTASYGELAARIGSPGSARAVGQALGRNPFAIIVPCHRVLAAGGRMGGFSANGGVATKLRLLALEGAEVARQAELFAGDGVPGFDPVAAVRHLRQADPKLGRLIDRVGPCRMELKRTPSVFGALAEAIVYQQLNGRAAATIYKRLCALFPRAGHHGPSARQILRASDEALRSAGLSGSKVLSLRDLAQRTVANEIPDLAAINAMADEEVVERLTVVRGIGRWTAEMLLMFRLGRPDVLPLGDYGIQQGFAATFGLARLPTREEMARRGERWKPYRTVASWYLWRATDTVKEPGQPATPDAGHDPAR